ncbi:MAG: hypothetical protein M3Q06_04850 [Bacteroidota bacterium]|nr:hypothetical protein [Bacteroidota bacterium]
MATTPFSGKVECVNPNTGGRMFIDAATYELFAKAIQHTLQDHRSLTYTQIVEGVNNYLQKKKRAFEGSVEWYTVAVKNDLQAKGVITVFTEKGKKMHCIAEASQLDKRKEPLK